MDEINEDNFSVERVHTLFRSKIPNSLLNAMFGISSSCKHMYKNVQRFDLHKFNIYEFALALSFHSKYSTLQ